MSLRLALPLAALLFLLTLLARLPAGLISWWLPVTCESASGTLWHGACAEVRTDRYALDNVQWTVHPRALWHAHLVADVSAADERLTGRAELDAARGGRIELHNLTAQLPLDNGWHLFLPGWRGQLVLMLPRVRVQDGQLAGLEGTARVNELSIAPLSESLGSYQLQFAPTGTNDSIGMVRDLHGPLSLAGRLVLHQGGAIEFDGSIAAHDAGDPVAQFLQALGPPGPDGRHTLRWTGHQ